MAADLVHQLDSTLHEKSRLAIAMALSKHKRLSFNELRDLLGMTDGNLCVHVRTLEQKGYLKRAKGARNGKWLTICQLSPKGKEALRGYLDNLERLVRKVRSYGRQKGRSRRSKSGR